MARIDQLLENYRRHAGLPLRPNLPLSQRVWFLVYPPEEERRLVNRVTEFEIATQEAGLHWQRIDLCGAFADWMDSLEPEHREKCFIDPKILSEYADPGFCDFVAEKILAAIGAAPTTVADRTVFALTGLMELYDFVHVSTVMEALDDKCPGIFLVFFPGEREGNTYRFLGARTGWDYLAVPILTDAQQ